MLQVWLDPFLSLRGAVRVASAEKTVNVSQGRHFSGYEDQILHNSDTSKLDGQYGDEDSDIDDTV